MENTELKHILIAYKSTNIGLQQAHDEILRLFNVVGRSEQLTCECVGLGSTECHKLNDRWICSKCNRPLAG